MNAKRIPEGEEIKMSEKGLLLKINSDDILDPRTRWICQRLDHLYSILTEMLVEVREMNSLLQDIQKAMYEK